MIKTFHAAGLEAQKQLDARIRAWDEHREQTRRCDPHSDVSDIWVRYNPLRNLSDDWAAFTDEHKSEWYPVVANLPAVWSIARKGQTAGEG